MLHVFQRVEFIHETHAIYMYIYIYIYILRASEDFVKTSKYL